MMFFAKCHVLARKFIEINNNIVANSTYIFQVNFAISSESKCMLCSKNKEKDYEWFLHRVRRGRCSISIALTKLDLIASQHRSQRSLANQNSRKNRQNGLSNKKPFYVFLQRSRTRLVSGLRGRSLASFSPWGGGEGTARSRLLDV